ncbi:ATP-binding protein [Candidatus Kuenenbacteria bacterium]|nr:ATP-binding protein [Candidatus Kuenenbacteria bacterium]
MEGNNAVSSIFQKGWDQYLKNTKIFLILSGSSMAMMESEALLYKSPLYGRRTGQLLLKSMQFKDAHKFFPKKSFSEFLEIFAIAGGTPAYLVEIDANKSLMENIKTKVFPPTEYLHNEIEFILKEELREPKNYLAILRAISWGKRKLGEIINYTGLEKNIIAKYLIILDRLQIVEREVPVTDENPDKGRKGLYQINDNFVRFWFQYIYPYKSDLEIGRYGEVLRKYNKSFQILTSVAYKQACRQLLPDILFKHSRLEKVGKWWDRNEEIDIVGINEETKEIFFGECKWSNKLVGVNIYENLKRKAKLVDWYKDKRKENFILFSKVGFTEGMVKIANKENVFLVKKNILDKF